MQKRVCFPAAILVLLAVAAGARPAIAQSKSAADEAAIKALYTQWNDAFNKKDVDAVMAVYAPDVFVFDAIPPREYPSWDAYKKDWQGLLTTFPGPLTSSVSELSIAVAGPVAYTHFIDDTTMTDKDGVQHRLVVRTTDVLRKSHGKWLIVQEHVSFPVDPTTGKADLLSTP